MSLLKAYLAKPSTQKALSLKPGEKGFSLIELVVVVAVLAILAAIAVPAFVGMNEDAANAAAQANLKGAYKECAYKIARGEAAGDATYTQPVTDGYFTYTVGGSDTAGDCDATLTATTTASHTNYNSTTPPYLRIVLNTGVKSRVGTITGVNW